MPIPINVTVKSVALMAVLALTVTVIFPDVAPAGTEVVMLVAVLAVTTAVVPLNLTILFAGVVLKFVPVMVTAFPVRPLDGVKLVMVSSVLVTMKSLELVAVFAPIVTVIFPVEAPAGTEVVMLVAVLAVTMAVVPLNLTMLLAGVVLKFVPVMITLVVTAPFAGVKLVIEGNVVDTVKFPALVVVLVPTVTVIFPVEAPTGTDVVMLVAVLAVTTAVVPLNVTMLFAGVVLKFNPVIVTLVVTGPDVGVKLMMLGNVGPPTS